MQALIQKQYTHYSFIILGIACFLSAQLLAAGGDSGFLYGKITMKSGTEYQGIIRWGDEEAFWDDMFNSEKIENTFAEYLEDSDVEILGDDNRDRRRRRGRSWFVSWGNNYSTTHSFKCRFGDIQEMRLRGSDDVTLTFKNGEELEVEGGSNDVGTQISIMDEELGQIDLNWRRISTIEFMETPSQANAKFGAPLYGTVETRHGTFKGFIQWDHDECLDTDILDGRSDDGKMKIAFSKITAIKKQRRGALVTLKSGREIYLDDSNDVDSDNKGIVVKDPKGFGKALIEWREFESIRFEDTSESGPTYSSFIKPGAITGSVKTRDGQKVSGQLAYDLDEAMDLEMLDGHQDRVEYNIPFRNIAQITPDRYGAIVKLKNGQELSLEDSRDIDEDNAGILVWESEDRAVYVPWENIKEVSFD